MKKAQWILLSITVIFICILLGMFIGKNFSQKYVSLSNPAAAPITNHAETNEAAAAGDGKLNINTAAASELAMLPGIGEVLAQNIIDYRLENGPFTTAQDLLLVDGIGEKRLDEILNYITVGG